MRNSRHDGDPGLSFAGKLLRELKSLFYSVRLQRKHRSLRLVESLALGEKRSLVVVAFEGRRYFLGVSAASIALLDRLDRAEFNCDPSDSGTTAKPDFALYFPQ